MAEIKANLIGDSEIAKVAAFFKFCRNKRELSGESYSDWEEFYKAPFKYANNRKAHKDSKCYAEALKALGMTTRVTDYAEVKFQKKWYAILPDGQSLADDSHGIIKPYIMDGVVRYTHGGYGSLYNEVKMFYGSDEWRKANDDLDKKYKELYDEAFANTETESEYDALCEELDAKMQAEYCQIYKNKFPLLEENEDGTWTEDSIALYDCYEMLNEQGTETFKLYVNQHDVELFFPFED